MKSKSAITYELEDIAIAAEELTEVLEDFELCKNSLGILYCEGELDLESLIKTLKPMLPFDIVGCTTQAVLDNRTGMNELATMLTVMTADDAEFGVFVGQPHNAQNIGEKIKLICEEAAGTLHKDAKLILCHTPFVPGIILDDYPDNFHKYAGGKPVFGGVAGYNIVKNFTACFYNENLYFDRIVSVFITGNIRPLFAVAAHCASIVDKTHVVTDSKDNIVYTVDGQKFADYLASVGIGSDIPEKYALDFVLASVTLAVDYEGGAGYDGVNVYRSMYKLNSEDGSGEALGRVPLGSKVSAVTYGKEDVNLSCRACALDIMKKIEENSSDGYTYSTILGGSCNGRYMFMFPLKDIEGNVIKDEVPPNINFAGYYTYGEICPTSVKDGIAVNRCHNATMTMCAL